VRFTIDDEDGVLHPLEYLELEPTQADS
jgi:hypothetical protein